MSRWHRHVALGHLSIWRHRVRPGIWHTFIDWRIREKGNRWRLVVGRQLQVPFSERHGHTTRKPYRRRVLGHDIAYYPRGLE